MKALGVSDKNTPSGINLYPIDFEAKDSIAAIIADYNKGKSEETQITYTDYVGLMMSSITTIINAISYILIAFVSISLIVSSIMIGIITYISVLERTKEIGVLRAIGASKKDVGRVFNAETLIVGFAAGMIGIIVTLLLNIPINIIIKAITDIGGIAARLFKGFSQECRRSHSGNGTSFLSLIAALRVFAKGNFKPRKAVNEATVNLACRVIYRRYSARGVCASRTGYNCGNAGFKRFFKTVIRRIDGVQRP
jgi:ABC-type antimicrobial peptide transport system permease subunit